MHLLAWPSFQDHLLNYIDRVLPIAVSYLSKQLLGSAMQYKNSTMSPESSVHYKKRRFTSPLNALLTIPFAFTAIASLDPHLDYYFARPSISSVLL
jgi:hypothetical protein